MHKANRLAGTGGHYRVRQTVVEGQDREREGTQILTYRVLGKQDTGGHKAMQKDQSPACTNRF